MTLKQYVAACGARLAALRLSRPSIMTIAAQILGTVLCLAVKWTTGRWSLAVASAICVSLIYGLSVTAEYYRCRAHYGRIIELMEAHGAILEQEMISYRVQLNAYRDKNTARRQAG